MKTHRQPFLMRVVLDDNFVAFFHGLLLVGWGFEFGKLFFGFVDIDFDTNVDLLKAGVADMDVNWANDGNRAFLPEIAVGAFDPDAILFLRCRHGSFSLLKGF
jgi:hypothetical protein